MATKRRPRPATTHINALMPDTEVAGRNITIGDFILEQINAGVDTYTAATAAGVTHAEFGAWIRQGTQIKERLLNGAIWETDFTAEEQDVAIFAGAAIRAASAHVSRLAVLAEQLARGGIEQTTTRTEVDNAGQVVKRVTTSSRTLPDAEMLRWKLQVHQPDVYGPKATIRVLVTDTTDTPERASIVEDRLRAIIERRMAAIETTATEVPPDPPSRPQRPRRARS